MEGHQPTKMTLADLLCVLRQRLLDAVDQNDRETLGELKTTLMILREASYQSEDKQIVGIVVTLEDCTRDFLHGMGWKENIPSIEAIKSALS